MGQYHEQLIELSIATHKSGLGDVFMGGPASVFTTYPTLKQTDLGWLFLIEFFVSSFLVCPDLCSDITRTDFVGPCDLVDVGSSEPFHHPINGSLRHRYRLRSYGLGIRAYFNIHESC
jgi:hypothetical protein